MKKKHLGPAGKSDKEAFDDGFKISCKLVIEKPTLFEKRSTGFPKSTDGLNVNKIGYYYDNLFYPSVDPPLSADEHAQVNKHRRKRYIRELEAKLTPGSKLAEITRNAKIVELALQYQQPGNELNIQALITWLRDQGALRVARSGGVFQDLSDSAVRTILRRKFDIKGKRGRHPR